MCLKFKKQLFILVCSYNDVSVLLVALELICNNHNVLTNFSPDTETNKGKNMGLS